MAEHIAHALMDCTHAAAGTWVQQRCTSLPKLGMAAAADQLMAAAKQGDRAGVAAALDAGADVNAGGQQQLTPLLWACRHGHAAVVEELLNKVGIDVHARTNEGYTALHEAAFHGAAAAIAPLVSAGCPAFALTAAGASAWDLGASQTLLTVVFL